jgi:hypothetical protein
MAVKTQGTQYYVKNNGNFVQIAGIESVSFSGGDSNPIDTTPMDATSPSSVAGSPSPEVLTFSIMYDPTDASHVALDTLKAAGTNTNWKKVLPYSGATNTKFWTSDVQGWPNETAAERNSIHKKTLTIGVSNHRSSE